jgi:predicted 2-oxoglutarate/Fe(II)-dependent dioxygenase YbiX
MACHIDNIHSLFDGNEKGIPVLSIVGIFNDNYKAGEFKILDKEIILKQGDILVFPSNFMFPHQVKTIEKGTRYSFVTWAY